MAQLNIYLMAGLSDAMGIDLWFAGEKTHDWGQVYCWKNPSEYIFRFLILNDLRAIYEAFPVCIWQFEYSKIVLSTLFVYALLFAISKYLVPGDKRINE